MVQAARRYGCVVSGGSQRVLDDHRQAGRKLLERRNRHDQGNLCQLRPASTPCYLPGQPVDSDVDWDMWLGPAPWAPFHPYRISGSFYVQRQVWRSWSDYSGGGMTDWGAHRFGGAMFAVGVGDQGPVEVIPPDGKDLKYLTYRFANGLLLYPIRASPMDGRRWWARPAKNCRPRPCPDTRAQAGFTATSSIASTREKPFRDIELASHRHGLPPGHHPYELNRPLKWDAVKEEFPATKRPIASSIEPNASPGKYEG